MEGILFALGSILVGIGLVRKLFPSADSQEKLFWGLSLGIVAPTWLVYLISRAAGSLNHATLIIVTIILFAGSAFFFRSDLTRDLTRKVLSPFKGAWYLLLLFALVFPVFVYFFNLGMFRWETDGMFLTATSWYDMALHVSLADSFVYGQNFPPMYPVLPDEALRYPFMPDFHAAIFIKLGWGLWSSFALTALWAAAALIGTFYSFARRLGNSSSSATIAGLMFFFSGGLGFMLFFTDWYYGDRSFVTHFLEMRENYTDMFSRGVKFVSLITSGLVPQRAMLYGMPIAFAVLSMMAGVWKQWWEDGDRPWREDAKVLLPAGVLTGLLPLFHVHSYMTVGLVSGFLFLLRPRRAWLVFWLPAVLLALPQLMGSGSELTSNEFLKVQLGWMSHTSDGFLKFMIMNFGLPLLLIVPALIKAPRYAQTFYVPFAAVMVICLVFRLSPNDFDNIKLIYYWYAATVVVVSVWLSRLNARPVLRPLVLLIVLACTASGFLANVRERTLIYRIYSPEEIEAGTFARDNTEPRSLFLTGQYHSQPALGLAGRRIFLGYDFWIVSHGYERSKYDALLSEVKKMYAGTAESEALINSRHIDYIYIGPSERSELKANEPYFAERYQPVYKKGDISIYKVSQPKQ